MIKTYCDICGKAVKTTANLLRIKDVSCGCDIDKVYMCKECSKKYDIMEKKLDTLFVKHHGNVTIK